MIFDDPYSATFGLEGIAAKDVWQTNSIAKGQMWSLNSPKKTGCFFLNGETGPEKENLRGSPFPDIGGKKKSLRIVFLKQIRVVFIQRCKGGYFSVTSLDFRYQIVGSCGLFCLQATKTHTCWTNYNS